MTVHGAYRADEMVVRADALEAMAAAFPQLKYLQARALRLVCYRTCGGSAARALAPTRPRRSIRGVLHLTRAWAALGAAARALGRLECAL